MEEDPEYDKESSYSAHARRMNKEGKSKSQVVKIQWYTSGHCSC